MVTEKRLIDANAIVVPKYDVEGRDLFNQGYCQGKTDGILEVKVLAPTVDAVEVVRCKNCEHSKKLGNNGILLCYRDKTAIHIVKPDAYCDGSQRRYAADDPEVLEFEPVVHGRWEKHGKHDWRCSVCKVGVPYSYTGHRYCHNCGAKMDVDWLGYHTHWTPIALPQPPKEE